MTITMHLCRGNYKSTFMGAGGYDAEAEVLFNRINVHGYFMEYDTERAGGFEPLRLVPKGKTVVLGLVTTKTGKLESKDELKRRIDEAAKFVASRPALPVAAMRLRLDRGGQHAHRGRAMGEAAADRRGRGRGVGAVALDGQRRTLAPSSPGLTRRSMCRRLDPAIHVFNVQAMDLGSSPGMKPSMTWRRINGRHRRRTKSPSSPARAAASAAPSRMLMAEEGAKVLVNDVGAALDGSGGDAGPAQQVVDEIKKAGRPGHRLDALDRRAAERRPDRQGRARRLRPRRHPGQQRRHPARQDLPSHELVGLVRRDHRCICTARSRMSRACRRRISASRTPAR